MMNILDFFTKITGLTPTDSQKELLINAVDLSIKKILISAGRQSGKTLCSAVIVLWYVFCYSKPLKILLISAQDNILYFHIRELFKKNPEFVNQLTERSRLAAELVPIKGFETIFGAVVFVKGSTTKQIMGTPADIVVIDEACEIKNNIIIEAMGCISGEMSKLILLSTPHKAESLFVELATEENPTFRIFTWSSENLSWHQKDMIEEKRKRMTKEQWATQVLGRPPTKQERAFFARKDVEECFQSVESIREGGVLSRIEIGIDTGNPTVLTVTERIGTTRRKLLFVKVWTRKYCTPDICGPQILEIIRNWKPYIVKMDSKPQEYVDWFRVHGNKVKPIDFSIHKEQMMGQLQKMIREHRLLIPTDFIYLKMPLEKYRLIRGEDNKERKTTGSDYVESLALSIYESESLQPTTGSIVVFPRPKK